MTTKELIRTELENLGEEDLQAIYGVIKRLRAAREDSARSGGILAKLKEVKIEAPEDFAANLDLYTTGEKRVEENLP